MKVLGLILELNPLHNGHVYFINQAKSKINPDLIIAVVSGNFAMRGDPMVIDKWTKSQVCLEYGIDIVCELPFVGSNCSADYFCHNAIATLVDLGVTDISFGVECNRIEKFHEIIDILNSSLYQKTLKSFLKQGFSYATSSNKAIHFISNDEEIKDAFSLPNNTLALGYLSAIDSLKPNIKVTLVQRIANQYYDDQITNQTINSATALRKQIANNKPISQYCPKLDYSFHNPKTMEHHLLLLLRYTMALHPITYFKHILGVTEGIEHRIASLINDVESYDELIKAIQTKRYTVNRIQRVLLNMIVGIDKKYHHQYYHYLRILAMKRSATPYINTLPKTIKKRILTSFKNKNDEIITIELRASHIYGLITKNPQYYLQEFQVPFIGDDGQ